MQKLYWKIQYKNYTNHKLKQKEKNMSDSYTQLLEFVKNMEADVEKFYVKGQSAAGTRVGKALSEVKKMAQDMRNEIQAKKVERKG